MDWQKKWGEHASNKAVTVCNGNFITFPSMLCHGWFFHAKCRPVSTFETSEMPQHGPFLSVSGTPVSVLKSDCSESIQVL